MSRQIVFEAIISVMMMFILAGCSNSSSTDTSLSPEDSSAAYLLADAGSDRIINIPERLIFETPSCDAVSVLWDFGDGGRAKGYKVEHQYRTPGKYMVSVSLTDPNGETAIDSCTVRVYPLDTDGDLLEDGIDDDPQSGDIRLLRDSRVFYIPTFDGEQLECQLYLPAGIERCPVVLLAHGWASSMDEMRDRALALRERGYAAMIYSSRGWGESSGLIRLNSSEYEVKDAIMLINWLSARAFVIEETKPQWFFANNRIFFADFNQDGIEDVDDIPGDEDRDFLIGLSGCSYGGALQIMAASYDHRIDVITPERTWHNLSQALCPSDSLKILWAGGFYIMGIARVLEGTGVDQLLTDFILTLLGTNEFKPEMREALLLRSPSERIGMVVAPTFIVQGENDTVFDLNQAVENFEKIRANGVEAKMYWYSRGHGYMPVTTQRIEDFIHEWLDRHLKGAGNGKTLAEFRYDLIDDNWKPDEITEYRSGSWPVVAREDETEFILHRDISGGHLKCAHKSGWPVEYDQTSGNYTPDEIDRSRIINIPFVKTSLSEIQALQGSLEEIYPPYDSTLTSITYESEEFKEDTEITGIPRLNVCLSSSASDITYFFKLYDAPSAAPALKEGSIEKVNSDAKVINWHVTPYRIFGSSKNSPEMHEIDLRGINYIIRKGHRIRLTVATSDFFFLHSRKTGDGFVWHEAASPSGLYLPIVRRPL